MALEALEGRDYPAGEPYMVGREQIRAFALAVGASDPVHHDVAAARAAGHRDVVAPPTFAVVVAQSGDRRVLVDPDAGIELSGVVHGEQSLHHHRPIVAGDELVVTTVVDSVRAMAGRALLVVRDEIADAGGNAVCTAVSTLVVAPGEPTGTAPAS